MSIRRVHRVFVPRKFILLSNLEVSKLVVQADRTVWPKLAISGAGCSYTGAKMDTSNIVHKGVWLRVGDRLFAFTVTRCKRVLQRDQKVRALLTLAEDQKSCDTAVEREVMDTSGKELRVISGIRGVTGCQLPNRRRLFPQFGLMPAAPAKG